MTDHRKEIRDWLQSELDRQGYGAKGKLAAHLGIRADGVTRMLNDKPGKENRDISADELVKMGEFFGKTPPIITTDLKPIVSGSGLINVVGKVAAHNWIDVDEMDFGIDDVEPIPASPQWPAEYQYGLLVEGNCLNKIAPHGSRLQVLNIKLANMSAQPGDLVIVERRRYGGQMIERTAKRLRQTANGYELWPESFDAAHQEPIVLSETIVGVEVEMIGKVLWILTKP